MTNPVEHYDYLFKLLFIGDSGVGKSCILQRFTDCVYVDSYISTIGVDFKIRTININEKVIKLQIFDTAGQERFRSITSSYYKGAHGIFTVYDITEPQSFEHIRMWNEEIQKYAMPNVHIFVVGSKLDLELLRRVETEEARLYADAHSFGFMECSAKTNANIDYLFEEMAKQLMKSRIQNLQDRNNPRGSLPLDNGTNLLGKKNCC